MTEPNTSGALIVGGGIGGLAAALCLHAKGVSCKVFESVREIRPLGVGINLLPHSVRILWALGLRDELEKTAILTRELRYHSKDGKEIWTEPRGIAAGYPWPQYSIHRGELQMTLLRAVKERIGEENVLTDHHFAGVEQDDAGVTARFISKKSGETKGSFQGKSLVGADGLMSGVRSNFFPNEGAPKFAGLMLWRGIVEAKPFMTGRTMVMAGHNNLKAVFYPISAEAERRGRSLINWVAERRVGTDHLHEREDWNRRGDKTDFVPHFKDWNFGWINVTELFEKTEEVFEYPMVDRDPIPRWTFGRVTLLGDAAHAMYPNGSNGASQAILDAETLADSLAEHSEPYAALAAYEAKRLPATSKLVLDNRQTGPERVLQMVEERCRGGCAQTHTCIPRAELEEISRSYKKLAGFDKESLDRRKTEGAVDAVAGMKAK